MSGRRVFNQTVSFYLRYGIYCSVKTNSPLSSIWLLCTAKDQFAVSQHGPQIKTFRLRKSLRHQMDFVLKNSIRKEQSERWVIPPLSEFKWKIEDFRWMNHPVRLNPWKYFIIISLNALALGISCVMRHWNSEYNLCP